MPVYSLGQKCLTEFLSTSLVLYLGESLIANELLPSTKGHAMGFGWVAFGFGMAFGLGSLLFGYCSAHMNPAAVIALWVAGEIPFVDCLCLALSEIAGGFFGALLMYITYIPHFKTIPEPAAKEGETLLLRTRDHFEPSALRIASYNTRSDPSQEKTIEDRIKDAKYYLTDDHQDTEHVFKLLAGKNFSWTGIETPFPKDDSSIPAVVCVDNGKEEVDARGDSQVTMEDPNGGGNTTQPLRRRHSIQVAYLQRKLRELERQSEADAMLNEEEEGAIQDQTKTIPTQQPSKSVSLRRRARFSQDRERRPSMVSLRSSLDRDEALHQAAVKADRAVKLSAFANRPAIDVPIHNFVVETFGTVVLVLGAFLLNERLGMIPGDVGLIAKHALGPFLLGTYVQVCIMCLGGPTGYSANSARDLGPRFAHYILPIPGKGSSEWWYAAVANAGMVLGGVIAGSLYRGMSRLPEPF